MLSKSQFKLINSLHQKKYRQRHQLFLAEGKKTINELLKSNLHLHSLYATEDLFEVERDKLIFIDEKELKKISKLSTPQTALALFELPQTVPPSQKGVAVALDGIRDPGNLGTIIRLCDWFGIEDLICSLDTVDCFNPKVVQATMGSIARVNLSYLPLAQFLKNSDRPIKIFGAFMEGENIYTKKVGEEGIIVMGNEANGISPEVEDLVTDKIAIPRFGSSKETESLNVATATAVLLSEFRRREFTEK